MKVKLLLWLLIIGIGCFFSFRGSCKSVQVPAPLVASSSSSPFSDSSPSLSSFVDEVCCENWGSAGLDFWGWCNGHFFEGRPVRWFEGNPVFTSEQEVFR